MMMDRSKPPGIRIGQIFLESADFKHRSDHLSLPLGTGPEVGDITIDVQLGHSEDETRGIVRLRVRTKPENNPIYEFAITMVALIEVDAEAPNMPIGTYVTDFGPTMLYPFVRQAVADVTLRGRFGPVWLTPANLTALGTSKGVPAKQKVVRRKRTKTEKAE